MLVRTLWSHLQGYVIIRAKGRRLEALINEAVAAGARLWRLDRATPRLLVARTDAANFRRIARTGRRLGVRVSALEKRGVPFVLGRWRRRRAFLLVGALFVGLFYGLSRFVWFVDVHGVERLPAEEVVAAAARSGLRPGVLRSDVEREEVVLGLHRELPRIAWAAVEIKGALGTVRVVERTEPDPPLQGPGHIVAAYDGFVERIVVSQGQGLVRVGDTVQRGQPLISGMLVPGSDAFARKVEAGEPPVLRAEGFVAGRVWYRGEAEVAIPPDEAGAVSAEAVAAAGRQASEAAEAAVLEAIPPDGEIKERDLAVVEDMEASPPVVRATLIVSVYQNLGRFSPVAPSPEADGSGLKDESDGQEDGQLQRPEP